MRCLPREELWVTQLSSFRQFNGQKLLELSKMVGVESLSQRKQRSLLRRPLPWLCTRMIRCLPFRGGRQKGTSAPTPIYQRAERMSPTPYWTQSQNSTVWLLSDSQSQLPTWGGRSEEEGVLCGRTLKCGPNWEGPPFCTRVQDTHSQNPLLTLWSKARFRYLQRLATQIWRMDRYFLVILFLIMFISYYVYCVLFFLLLYFVRMKNYTFCTIQNTQNTHTHNQTRQNHT